MLNMPYLCLHIRVCLCSCDVFICKLLVIQVNLFCTMPSHPQIPMHIPPFSKHTREYTKSGWISVLHSTYISSINGSLRICPTCIATYYVCARSCTLYTHRFQIIWLANDISDDCLCHCTRLYMLTLRTNSSECIINDAAKWRQWKCFCMTWYVLPNQWIIKIRGIHSIVAVTAKVKRSVWILSFRFYGIDISSLYLFDSLLLVRY